jgi:hypothetical protein
MRFRVQVLTGVELLLLHCQKWETVASRDVSLGNSGHLTPLSALVTRWRRVELQAWPELLRARELQREQACQRWWFHLYGLVAGPAAADAAAVENAALALGGAEAGARETAWLCLPGPIGWLCADMHKAAAVGGEGAATWASEAAGESTAAAAVQNAGAVYRASVLGSLEAWVRDSDVGEFEPRLRMLYAFAALLALDPDTPTDGPADGASDPLADPSAVASARLRLAGCEAAAVPVTFRSLLSTTMYQLYRFYAQHSPAFREHRTRLQGPVERKVRTRVGFRVGSRTVSGPREPFGPGLVWGCNCACLCSERGRFGDEDNSILYETYAVVIAFFNCKRSHRVSFRSVDVRVGLAGHSVCTMGRLSMSHH